MDFYFEQLCKLVPTKEAPYVKEKPILLDDLDMILKIYNAKEDKKEEHEIVKGPDSDEQANFKPLQAIDFYRNVYNNTVIIYTEESRNTNNCSNCGKKMVIYPNQSELRCSVCGNIMVLQGIVFEDAQFYNQQVSGRAKKYSENAHCEKWLYRILAREKSDIPQRVLAKLMEKMKNEYRADCSRTVSNLKCEKIRGWLKECKITDYNNHAPLLRKILTSEFRCAVIPPQLTTNEIQTVLNEYNTSMEVFQEIIKKPDVLQILGRSKIKNRFYYPYVLWKILEIKFRKDRRLPGLLECIHLPSADTLKRNDVVWKMICPKMGYTYMPTDRSILSIL
jgi:hypothetical protein